MWIGLSLSFSSFSSSPLTSYLPYHPSPLWSPSLIGFYCTVPSTRECLLCRRERDDKTLPVLHQVRCYILCFLQFINRRKKTLLSLYRNEAWGGGRSMLVYEMRRLLGVNYQHSCCCRTLDERTKWLRVRNAKATPPMSFPSFHTPSSNLRYHHYRSYERLLQRIVTVGRPSAQWHSTQICWMTPRQRVSWRSLAH